MDKTYKQLCSEIEALKKQAEVARKQEIAKAVAEVRRLIKTYSLSAADCGFAGGGQAALTQKVAAKAKRTAKARKTERKPVAVKYRHPENAALTWTGRGRAPRWIVEEEARGKTRQMFAV